MNTFFDKVIIITGAGSGLGRAFAHFFAMNHSRIAICDRNDASMSMVKAELAVYGKQVLALTADISDEIQVDQFVNQTMQHFGRIDILINNAAIFKEYTIADMSLDCWNEHFTNNLTSAFLMTLHCLPHMRRQRSGKIINITSSLAKRGAAGFGAYCATKAALQVLTDTINEEEEKNGIQGIAVDPGVMRSGMHAIGVLPELVAPKVARIIETQDFEGILVNVDSL